MPFRTKKPDGCNLPILMQAPKAGMSLLDEIARLQPKIAQHLQTVGGVLLRGFDVPSVDTFQDIARSFGHPLLSYEFASTPRSSVSKGVYTSTEYPAHQHIPLHNEQAYTREWPMKIWFHCVTEPEQGGETPIADSRRIYKNMPVDIRERFAEGLLYVRNYGDFDVPWQQVFGTEDPNEVEQFCERAHIDWEWKEEGGLRTIQFCQGVEQHPVTKDWLWFNQAHLFHVSNLQPEVRESLEELLDEEDMPRNVFYADGEPINDDTFASIRKVLDEQTVIFPWQKGDVVMLDNMLAAHARTPFSGTRKIVVAMAEGHNNFDTFDVDDTDDGFVDDSLVDEDQFESTASY